MPNGNNPGYFLHTPGRLSRGAVLDVGLKCVHSCKFCYYSYLDGSDDQFRGMRRAEFRTLEECKEILRLLAAQGFVNFDFTGGEPTLHQNIIEITRYAHQELGLKGRIITLGQYLMRRMKNCQNERLIDDLLEAGLVNFLFSMHAVDEALFERLTGESWERQRRAMEYLDEKGFQFTSNTTVVDWNYRHLPDIAREILRHGIYLHNFIIMNAYYEWNRDGRAFGVQARYSDIHPYLSEAVAILESNDVAVNIRYAPLCAVRGMEKNLVGMLGVRYDPYEWMNAAGHFGGTPAQCAARLPVREGGIEDYLTFRPTQAQHDNGVRVTGVRGANLKHFGEPCARCGAREVCDGIDPNYLKNHGPDEFVPYDTPERAPLHRARYTYIMPFLVKTEPYADMKAVVKEAFAAWRKLADGADRVDVEEGRRSAAALPGAALEATAALSDSLCSPKVSVVITCYNYGRYLSEAVGSVLAQTFRDFEIIIVDDGSTDDTPQVCERLVADCRQVAIRVIRQPNSGQPAHARNRGIREARGQYILCLDADDMIAPTMLERCVAALEADPTVAIAYTDRVDFDGVTELVKAAPYDPVRLPYQNHISYCALYRRCVWEDVGGYRDNVKGCEDWDFWVAACARGYYGRYIPEPLFLYRRHDTGLYQHALAHFEEKRAQIMLNNPTLYRAEDLAWARATLARQAAAQQPLALHHDPGGPLVTVIIPTHNRARLLADALASLVAQDYPNWEGIVVNDGGEDVAAIVAAADPERSRLRYFCHPRSLGPGAARNTALKFARGEIVCYLDDDDLWRTDHLSTVVAALHEDGCDFVYTDAVLVPERIEPDGQRTVLGAGHNPYAHLDFSRERLLVANYIPICTWAHRWELVRQAGLFDDRLPVLEDWEYLIRLARYSRPKHLAHTSVEVRVREGLQQQRTGLGQEHLAVTWRDIYERSRDLADELTARARTERLALVEAGYVRPTGAITRSDALRGETERYQIWRSKHGLQEIDGELFAERMMTKWGNQPEFVCLVVVGGNELGLLADTVDSLALQLYKNWRLIVVAPVPSPDPAFNTIPQLVWIQAGTVSERKRAVDVVLAGLSQAWLWCLLPGARLEPHAMLRMGDYINSRMNWRLIYSDHDRSGHDGGMTEPWFKPDFNLDLLRSMDYIGPFTVRADTVLEAGGYSTLEGAETYDLALRVLDRVGEEAIGHIADVLVHLPETGMLTKSDEAAMEAVRAHLRRAGIAGEVTPGYIPGTHRVTYAHAEQPLVSIIIPNRDKLEFLKPCVESLLAKTSYPYYEVIIVDNQSTDPDVLDYYRELEKTHGERVRLLSYDAPFNFSAMNNLAARQAKGDYLLLLNNDTQIVQPQWLERMLNYGQRPEVGIVGARLVYPETGKLQHAGVVLGLHGVADHPFNGRLGLNDPGYMKRALVDQNYSAVSAACMLVRKTVYQQVAEMDEDHLKVLLNDVDLCLKVGRAGYKVVWTPYATVVHHGSSSIKSAGVDLMKLATDYARAEQERAVMLERWLPVLATDPAYNRHLSLLPPGYEVESTLVIDWDPNFHDRPRLLGLPLAGGSGEYRIIGPFRALSRAGLAHGDVVQGGKYFESRVVWPVELARAQPDTFVLHATLGDAHLKAMHQYRQYNKDVLLVFSLDDLVTELPPENSFHRHMPRDVKPRLRKALSLSDRVVVSTEPIANLCRTMHEDVRVLPNRLENAIWGHLTSRRRVGRKPRVGWAGAQQHAGDLALIADVVKATAQEVDWVFFGMCPDALRPHVREYHDFVVSFYDYPAKLASLDLDLAVAPLAINAFNEAKSNLRLLEYGILGWPVVCTDIHPYRDAPVKRVPNTTEAWVEAIRERIHDLDAAQAEGDELREWVRRHYLLENHLDEWLRALTR
ncbi:glycosyltransferase [Thiobacter aerophilum]|uniref:Glycosyltransferase n=1 Tax=Thiobacter aerophilum TaxID=3121275 RepID=A0ABV0EAM5_9BURK